MWLLLLCLPNAQAKQNQLADSLEQLLVGDQLAPEKRAEILNEAAFELRRQNPNRTLELAREANKLATQYKLPKQLYESLKNQGHAYRYKSVYDTALSFYQQALATSQQFALEKEEAGALNNIGNVYFKTKNIEKAYQYYLQSYELRKGLNDKKGMSAVLGNLGNIANAHLKDFDLAEKYYKQSLQIDKELGRRRVLPTTLANLANIYRGRGDLKEALKFYKNALLIEEELNMLHGQSTTLLSIGKTYYIAGDYQEADQYLSRSADIARELSSPERLEKAYGAIAINAEAIGDFEKAYTYQKQERLLADSIFRVTLSEDLARLEAEFNAEQQQKELEILQQKNQLQEAKINRLFWERLALALGSLLLLLGAVAFWLRFKEKSVLNNQLSEQHEELVRNAEAMQELQLVIEEQNQALHATNETLEENVRERTEKLQKTYYDLLVAHERLDHITYRSAHELKGPIARLLGLCQVAFLQMSNTEDKHLIKRMQATSQEMNRLLSQILRTHKFNRKEPVAQKVDVRELIEEVFELLKKITISKTVNWQLEEVGNTCYTTDREMLRTICRNILHNSIKFHHPNRDTIEIKVLLEQKPKHFAITFINNGCKIEPELQENLFQMFTIGEEPNKGAGLGLYEASLLADKLSGTLELLASNEEETCFRLTLSKQRKPTTI